MMSIIVLQQGNQDIRSHKHYQIMNLPRTSLAFACPSCKTSSIILVAYSDTYKLQRNYNELQIKPKLVNPIGSSKNNVNTDH